jgi:hypothetical protein
MTFGGPEPDNYPMMERIARERRLCVGQIVNVVYLREVDAGTDNACWVVCNKVDPGAVRFTDE